MINKILGGFFSLFFAFAAVVQFNDPDSLFWIMLYALATLASVGFMFNKLKLPWAIVLGVIYVVLAVYHWPEEFEGVALQDGMKTMNIELGRESLGMGIAALVMFLFAFLGRKKN